MQIKYATFMRVLGLSFHQAMRQITGHWPQNLLTSTAVVLNDSTTKEFRNEIPAFWNVSGSTVAYVAGDDNKAIIISSVDLSDTNILTRISNSSVAGLSWTNTVWRWLDEIVSLRSGGEIRKAAELYSPERQERLLSDLVCRQSCLIIGLLLRGTPLLLGLGVKDWERLTFFPQVLHRKPFGHLKDEGAFQHKEFFALCPSKNSWQIDVMNAKRKFQVFVILLLARGILVQAMEFA